MNSIEIHYCWLYPLIVILILAIPANCIHLEVTFKDATWVLINAFLKHSEGA